MADGVKYPTEDHCSADTAVPPVKFDLHLVTMDDLEHELLDKDPQEWADEAAAGLRAL